MKLLFVTIGTIGSSELKDLLGFIDADIKIQNIVPDLITATNDIIDLIGKPVYEKVVELYNEGSFDEDDSRTIYSVRYPIAVNAYRLFTPSNDLAHTNNGRKMRQDDGEKQAFEWMLDRDNAALEKRYYRALDDLIKFLDNCDNEELQALWKASYAYKKTHDLFIRTVAEFDSFFPINSRLLLIKLAPGISDCEQYEIRSRVGAEKLNVLKHALKQNTPLTEAKDLELIRLIRKASVAYSMAWSMMRFSVQLYPEGVLQHVTSDRATTRGAKPTLKSETEAARQAFMNDFDRVIKELEKLLEPEPTVSQSTKILPDLMSGENYFSA
jgi:hypothetical protein